MDDFDRSDEGGYNRPRRPNPETITYLRGIPLDYQIATEEIKAFLEQQQGSKYQEDDKGDGDDDINNDEVEFPQAFAAAFAALDEIRNEVASLAGDEFGSQSIELLAHITSPYSEVAARILLNGCSGYHLHLATHRYGSHVVQSILQLAVSYASSKSDLTSHEDAPQYSEPVENLPSLEDLIHGMVEELSPHADALAIHVCGSHVLRTLLCVLGGIDLVAAPGQSNANRGISGALLRGRKKNKKKKKKPVVNVEPHAGVMHVEYRKNSRLESVQEDMFVALNTLSTALTGEVIPQSPGELQTLSCHSSAGPLLVVLLRVLTYSSEATRAAAQNTKDGKQSDTNASIADFRLGIAAEEPKFEVDSPAHLLVKRLLCWKDDDDQKDAANILYGLSGEPRGSHILETILRLAPDSVYDEIVKLADFADPASMQDYAEHDVSNFVVQTLFCTVRNQEQAENLLKAVEKVIASGLAIDPTKRRRGILWRAVELSAKYRVHQDSLLKAIRLGFAQIQTSDNDAKENDDTQQEQTATTEEGGKKKKLRKKASAVSMKDIVISLIGLRKPEQEGGRLVLDPAGSRTIYHLLRFVPRLCEDVLKILVEDLSTDDLVLLAKDGLGSRCIMDGILDGPTKGPIFSAAVKSFYGKMAGQWVHLSLDRVGHHTVKKTFNALPRIDDKAKLVEEIVDGGNRLQGNSMGRGVLVECAVEDYLEGKKQWRQIIAKRLNKNDEKWLGELSFEDKQRQEQQKQVEAADTETAAAALQTKSKRKRKRKKPNNAANGDAGDDDLEQGANKKVTSAQPTAVNKTTIAAA